MKKLLLFVLIGLWFESFSLAQFASVNTKSKDLIWADSILKVYDSKETNHSYATIIFELSKSYTIFAQYSDTCKMSEILGIKCNTFDKAGNLDSALIACQKALEIFLPICDSLRLVANLVYYSNVHLSLGENEKVVEITESVLDNWNPAWGFTRNKIGIATNRAIALAYMGRTDESLDAFRQVLQSAIKLNNKYEISSAYSNLGAMFGTMANGKDQALLDSTEYYLYKKINLESELDPVGEDLLYSYMNLAVLLINRKRYHSAFVYLDSAQVLAERLGNLNAQINLSFNRSTSYADVGEYLLAYKEMNKMVKLRDSLLTIEKFKSIADMQEKYESAKKEGEIKELKIQNLDSLLKEEKATRSRNIMLFSGVGVLIMALGLWNRLLFTRKSKAAIEKEKEISESLLLNILPAETAKELKEKGHSEANLIDQVTVLFTDFKGFTALSEMVTPKELVHDLHECFSSFDRICEKYGIEKIKTIGDAYMAAGGLPVPNSTHTIDVINAALEMVQVVEDGKARKIAQELPFFEIRVGIHTGPVVAGIVGVKKFQYDIWGDTVNTASRMESSGEVGKVNISGSTFNLVKEYYICTHRGRIKAKGKGALDMYFVEGKA